MTPPDSGERRQGKSHLHVGKKCGPSCPDSPGIEFKPDSGEREVPAFKRAFNETMERTGHHVSIPLSLAQRILAALESEAVMGEVSPRRLAGLASELRAAVERKP